MKREESARINVTALVVDFIKQEIMAGKWLPGEKITSENKLAAKLHVSRSTIRAAIQQMIAIGVLESRQGKGTILKSLSMEHMESLFTKMYINPDIMHLLEFRRIIEVESSRLAAIRMPQTCLKNMKKYLMIMEENVQNPAAFIMYDILFHQEILNATGNQIIAESMKSVREEIEKQHYRFNTSQRVANALKFHKEVYQAFVDKDPDKAAQIMAAHLDSAIKNDLTLEDENSVMPDLSINDQKFSNN